ncbi:MAG: hypothetical protein WCO21_02325 [bacterium]
MANYLFRILIYYLKHEVNRISWVRDLRDPECHSIILNGMNSKLNGHCAIYLHADLQTEPYKALKILVHETFHSLSSMDTHAEEEWFVRRFTSYFWRKSTDKQKLFLLKFLPGFAVFSPQPR